MQLHPEESMLVRISILIINPTIEGRNVQDFKEYLKLDTVVSRPVRYTCSYLRHGLSACNVPEDCNSAVVGNVFCLIEPYLLPNSKTKISIQPIIKKICNFNVVTFL